jgi:hypothetical protein
MDYVADRLGDGLDTVAKVYADLARRRCEARIARRVGLKGEALAAKRRRPTPLPSGGVDTPTLLRGYR